MRAQLNPEKVKKVKPAGSTVPKKDTSILRKPVDISCSSITDVVALLDSGTEEVITNVCFLYRSRDRRSSVIIPSDLQIKQLLNNECDIIYECKVCKNLFRSLLNFISHKRVYCCDAYNVLHSRTNEVSIPIYDLIFIIYRLLGRY